METSYHRVNHYTSQARSCSLFSPSYKSFTRSTSHGRVYLVCEIDHSSLCQTALANDTFPRTKSILHARQRFPRGETRKSYPPCSQPAFASSRNIRDGNSDECHQTGERTFLVSVNFSS